MKNAKDHTDRLRARIIALEVELATYAARYGLTEAARELLRRPVE